MNKIKASRVAFFILLVLFVSLTYFYFNIIFVILSVVSALINIGAFLYKNDKEENKPQGYNPQPSQPQEYQPHGQTLNDNSINQFVG